VPGPIDSASHSGKLVVRLGRDLHRRSAHMAAIEGVSLNQFIVSSVAERVGMSAHPLVSYMGWVRANADFAFQLTAWPSLLPRHAGSLIEVATPTETVHVRWQDDHHA